MNKYPTNFEELERQVYYHGTDQERALFEAMLAAYGGDSPGGWEDWLGAEREEMREEKEALEEQISTLQNEVYALERELEEK
jgi:hypothetical protein